MTHSPPPEDVPAARLLVIDDEEAVLRLLQEMLTRAGHDVTTCESAEEALRLLGQSSYDCVLTDAMMPAMSGYELARRLRARDDLSHLPILMLTRKRHRDDVKKAVEAGITDYVTKPIDEQLLLEKVDSSLKKSRSVPKRASSDVPVLIRHSDAELRLSCSILTLNERELVLRLPILLEERTPFHLRTPVFDEIGIEAPSLELLHCDRVDSHYVARFAFPDLDEASVFKIRAWLLQQR